VWIYILTEGIIDKVFAKYEIDPLWFYGYKNDLEQLKQELKAEIEKEFQAQNEDEYYITWKDTRFILIGNSDSK